MEGSSRHSKQQPKNQAKTRYVNLFEVTHRDVAGDSVIAPATAAGSASEATTLNHGLTHQKYSSSTPIQRELRSCGEMLEAELKK